MALHEFDTGIAAMSEPAPGLRARADVVDARFALARIDLIAAADASHRALPLTIAAGLPLIQIDALETIAVIPSPPATTPRPLGSSARLTPKGKAAATSGVTRRRATQSLIDQFASTQASAWDAGTAESLTERPPVFDVF
jgi:hypothetical protein